MSLLRCLLGCLCLCLSAGAATAGSGFNGGGDARAVRVSIAPNEPFMAALNRTRAQRGLSPLRPHPQLSAAAQFHAENMRKRNFFSHRGPRGGTHSSRIKRAGYRACTSGEAIAMGIPSEQSVFTGWMNSKGHRRILMGRKFTHFGLARSGGYWVYVAGRPC